ncbi:MAG: chorismate mutase [Candidatus Scalindua sp.]|jgi:chorismate mutase|nr:chorismate mutase [Candidatus Scalindua sp.]MBT5303590.1 chorismate mutase [Candidatus Scalindua sp.]MBT6046739.1 chorismate mutase [Candidatus Scalindua sp.]MBT6229339.1 chorismate mutase [Candidatus Scalindua sp.]MBT7211394.1 chorismate mutase [Candidatus Scalindua sp.]
MRSIFFACLLSIFSLQTKAEVTSIELFRTINERLSYMEDVALFKVKNHLPIEDIQRENDVIDKAKVFASEQGFDSGIVKDFFRAQISVAKAIQYRYRADLLSQPSFRQPRDLQKEVRPALIRLGNQIIEQMAAYCKNHGEFQKTQFTEFNEAIIVKYVTETDKQLLFRALLKVKQ